MEPPSQSIHAYERLRMLGPEQLPVDLEDLCMQRFCIVVHSRLCV
jgi:hypothetical protein